jgi:hypothetical protein
MSINDPATVAQFVEFMDAFRKLVADMESAIRAQTRAINPSVAQLRAASAGDQ